MRTPEEVYNEILSIAIDLEIAEYEIHKYEVRWGIDETSKELRRKFGLVRERLEAAIAKQVTIEECMANASMN